MAPTQSTPSFDDIIQAGRQKKRNEDLANEILGKNRRSSTPSGHRTNSKKLESLASRISKPNQPIRASSSSALNKTFKKGVLVKNFSRNDLTEHLSQATNQTQVQEVGSGFSIRGIAGPGVVIGRNFAPGTTAADIQSAMESVGGDMQSCILTSTSPTVTAEMVFPDKANADAVIATFNNQKADGRILHLFLKKGPPAAVLASGGQTSIARKPIHDQQLAASYEQSVEPQINDKHSRHADPEVQDGSFGFGSQPDQMAVDVDVEASVDERREDMRSERREDWRDDRRDDHRDSGYSYGQGHGRRDERRDHSQYNQFDRADTRDLPRGPRQDYRGAGGRGSTNDRGLYSDGLYRHRGRGYR